MKQFLIKALLVWVMGTILLLLASEILVERASIEDITGFTSYSFIYYIAIIFLVYLPFFHILQRKEVSARHFWWIAPVLLNLPLYILFYQLIDQAFRASEAILFMCLFFFFGVVFGRLYYRYRGKPALQR